MASNGILEVTDANFDQDVLKSDQPVLVDFWAAWCGPCRALAPIVDELAKHYDGKIKVGKMDVDSNSATPMRYGVRGIPTLLVFKGGQVRNRSSDTFPRKRFRRRSISTFKTVVSLQSSVFSQANSERPGLLPGRLFFGVDGFRI